MRLVTRADWDGLVSAVLLTTVEQIEAIQFAYPKDIQDGKVNVTDNAIVVNLPYHPSAALWFDHHSSEEELAVPMAAFTAIKGKFGLAPSAARLIYDYYGGDSRLAKFAELLAVTDRVDSAQLTQEDVLTPEGYVLLAYTVDPRSGLRGHDLEEYFLQLVDWLKVKSADEILNLPDVKRLVEHLKTDDHRFREALLKHSRQEANVVITDFRGMPVPAGNRYLVYVLFPQANVSTRLYDGKVGYSSIAVGHSLFNRTCKVNVGKLLAEYGGGGHVGAGTAQFPNAEAEAKFKEIIGRLKEAA
jgi:hypothetical protein